MAVSENIISTKLIKDLNFCVFDLETTGGNQKLDNIIEIGLVKVTNLKIIEQKTFLIKPIIKIPEFIQKLTSISEEDVIDAPLIEDVIDEILEFMSDSILVAHNTSFDIPFFNSVLERLNKPKLTNKSICTNLMTRYLIPNLLNTNLTYMSKIFDIYHGHAHRALDDAQATAELLIKYLEIFIKKEIQKVNHLYYPRNKYELDRINFRSSDELDKIINKIKSIRTPYLLNIKGSSGIIITSFPALGTKEDLSFISKKISSSDWQTISLQLFGTFLETIVSFFPYFNRLPIKERNYLLGELKNIHFTNEYEETYSKLDQIDSINYYQFIKDEIGDFIIAKHLVPDQLIIFPANLIKNKSHLVFRHPGHQKKLSQYINSKYSKNTNIKSYQKNPSKPILKFLLTYLVMSSKNLNDNKMLFFKFKGPESIKELNKKLTVFSSNNPHSYHYPKEYI